MCHCTARTPWHPNQAADHAGSRAKVYLQGLEEKWATKGQSPAVVDRITGFSDEEKRKTLCDFTNDIWIKCDNYGWTDEQVACLIVVLYQNRMEWL